MSIFRYALFDYRTPTGMLRGYFGAIRDFGERAVVQPGEVLPVCVSVGAVPRLVPALWSKPGTTTPAGRRREGIGHALTPAAFARSRTYGPLYHRRQRCLVPASGYYLPRGGAGERYVRSRDRALLALAGLWEERVVDGNTRLAYVVVACMEDGGLRRAEPLVLEPEQCDAWLDQEDPRHLLLQRPTHLVECATAAAPGVPLVDLAVPADAPIASGRSASA